MSRMIYKPGEIREQLTHRVLKDKAHYLKVVARLFSISIG